MMFTILVTLTIIIFANSLLRDICVHFIGFSGYLYASVFGTRFCFLLLEKEVQMTARVMGDKKKHDSLVKNLAWRKQ